MRTQHIPTDIKNAILKRHSHEGPDNKPLWLLWRIEQESNIPSFPVLDAVCDSIRSIEYHVLIMINDKPKYKIWVEKVPANHEFGSMVLEVRQMEQYHKIRTARIPYFLDKD